MTNEQLQQAIDKEEKALTEFLERANTEAAFRRGPVVRGWTYTRGHYDSGRTTGTS